jgi:hypothetical protein
MMTIVYRSPVIYFMGYTHQCTMYKSTYIRLYIWETERNGLGPTPIHMEMPSSSVCIDTIPYMMSPAAVVTKCGRPSNYSAVCTQLSMCVHHFMHFDYIH